ncbi:MAG: hypothetical protein ACRD88_02635, partial [Terriglobia bacterium]
MASQSSSRRIRCAVLLSLIASALITAASGQESSQAPAREVAQPLRSSPAARETRQRFLEMFARTYFPGRSGQLAIVPREGDIITRPGEDVPFMHGSPWSYDGAIPLMFAGPAVKAGEYKMPARQQDVAPTLAAALGMRMPATATGHVLPV